MTHRATGIGSMPGTDYRDTADLVVGELGDLPFVPELPARGVHAGMVARAVAMVRELGFDLQPAGWRLTDAPGVDHRRATSLLAHDLDLVEEVALGRRGPVKAQVAGPWTLAALVERPRGDKVLGDHGARRELAQALADGVADHLAGLRRRLGGSEVVLQVDEPMLPAVLGGALATASGFGRHRAVQAEEAVRALDWVLDAAGEGPTAVHCCAADVPVAVLAKTRAAALSFDATRAPDAVLDDLGGWLDAGREVWLGVVPSVAPPGPPPGEAELTRAVLAWWSKVGYSDADALPPTTVTPTCGLAGATPAWARGALDRCAAVARNLSAEAGRIGA